MPQIVEEGADIVIALAHTGIARRPTTTGLENAATPLARVDGIDAMLTGHQHLVYPSPTFDGIDTVDTATGHICGKPAVMGGFWGDNLGVIDLLLERDGNGWKVVSSEVETRPIYKRNEDRSITADWSKAVQEVLDSVADEHEATLEYIRRPVGKSSAPLQSYFALVADDPSRADRQPGADLVHRADDEGHRRTRACRSSRRRRRSRPAAAAGRNTTPMSPPATWRSRTSPTSTSTRTPSGR